MDFPRPWSVLGGGAAGSMRCGCQSDLIRLSPVRTGPYVFAVSLLDEQHWDAAQEGAELLVEGELKAAETALSALSEREPDNCYAFFFLGNALYEQAKYVRALRAYLTALALAPDYLGAMVATGHTLRMLGRYDEAIRMGRQVLSRAADDGDALFLMGSCHFARGDNAAAEEYLERFLATGPELEVATEAQGMLQVLRGEVLAAVADDDDVN